MMMMMMWDDDDADEGEKEKKKKKQSNSTDVTLIRPSLLPWFKAPSLPAIIEQWDPKATTRRCQWVVRNFCATSQQWQGWKSLHHLYSYYATLI